MFVGLYLPVKENEFYRFIEKNVDGFFLSIYLPLLGWNIGFTFEAVKNVLIKKIINSMEMDKIDLLCRFKTTT